MDELVELFKKIDTNGLPDFNKLTSLLDQALWVLFAAKVELTKKRMSANEIASILVEVKEISVKPRGITNAFNKAKGKKVHVYTIDSKMYYEIMNSGKDYLLQKTKMDSIQVHYFEPGRRYTSKAILCEEILSDLKGELKIVDPYCGLSTLDVLLRSKIKNAKILTCIDNLKGNQKDQFLRGFKDFVSEGSTIELRNYSSSEIHDRYILSNDQIILLGQSIKDLGSKESFAIVLGKDSFGDIYQNLFTVFDRRWNQAKPLS
jgi:hypothetical protein